MSSLWVALMCNAVGVSNVFEPAPHGAVAFGGWLGERLDACIDGGLLPERVDVLVKPFADKTEVGNGDWRCEYWGKWFTGLALADAYRHNAETAKVRDEAVAKLVATAAPDGYIGTRQPENRGLGWDIWGRKYALLGLLGAYDRTGDAATLRAAEHAADTLLAEYGPGGRHLPDWGYEDWRGLPSNSVLEPIVLLYERSGEQRYLDFARHIVAGWDKPGKLAPNGMRLIEDALARKKPTEMISSKAYEMMSCFEGLCELYRATGEADFLAAPLALAESIMEHECTLVGPGSGGEGWCDGRTKQTGVINKPQEVCVTATWMKLCYQLLRLTGEARWADELERCLYNGLLASQMADGRWWAYFASPNGERVPSYVQHAEVGLSCCVVNGPRGLMITPLWAAGSNAQGAVLNLLAPGTVRLQTPSGQPLGLDIGGNYPFDLTVPIKVGLERPERFALTLRIPAWSQQTSLLINGEGVPLAGPGYVAVERDWQPGDRLEVTFDQRVQVQQAPDGNGQIALTRGPVVLSLDERLNPQRAGQATLPIDGSGCVAAEPDPAAAQAIGAPLALAVQTAAGPLIFCDYASAGSAYDGGDRFRSWLTVPLNLATMYETGQTWQTLSHKQDGRPEVPATRFPAGAAGQALQ